MRRAQVALLLVLAISLLLDAEATITSAKFKVSRYTIRSAQVPVNLPTAGQTAPLVPALLSVRDVMDRPVYAY